MDKGQECLALRARLSQTLGITSNLLLHFLDVFRGAGVYLQTIAAADMVRHMDNKSGVHGGGFAGTIQAFVPHVLLDKYVDTLEHVFGKNSCHKLFIRQKGAVKVEL